MEGGDGFGYGMSSIFEDRGEIAEQSLKAVDLDPLAGLFGAGLELGSLGALCGSDDGSTRGLGLRLVIIIEKNGSQELAHVPLHVIGQNAKQDVSADAIGQAEVNGTHMQIDSLQTAKSSLHPGEAFVAGHDLLA